MNIHNSLFPSFFQPVDTPLAFSGIGEIGEVQLSVSKDQKKRHSMDLLDLRIEDDSSASKLTLSLPQTYLSVLVVYDSFNTW